MHPKKTDRNTNSTLSKAMNILGAIVDQPQSVGVPDLADRLGMSRQSLHRLLAQLEAEGLIIKMPNRERYAIGERFSKLALDTMCSANKGIPLRAVLQTLVEEIGEGCNLGVISGQDFVYLERVEAIRTPRIYLETGTRIPAHCTSGGKAMLAFLPDPVRARLIKTMTLQPFTNNTITSRKEFAMEIVNIRERGFAVAVQEFADGIIGVGVPVLGSDGEALASLAMHAPMARLPVENAPDVAGKLQVAARNIAEIWDVAD